MSNLSPAAQAILDAFDSVSYYPDENDEGMLAAALRAAAEFIDNGDASEQLTYWANELEGAQ